LALRDSRLNSEQHVEVTIESPASLVKRHSRYVLLAKVANRDSKSVAANGETSVTRS